MNQKQIILLGSFGLFPFYINSFFLIFFPKLYVLNFDFFRQISNIYGTLIVCFLSGMHWERIINQKKIYIYALPMLSVIIAWSNQLIPSHSLNEIIVIFLLIWCLIIDLKLLKETSDLWYKKLRIYLTLLAVLSFFPQFFYQCNQWVIEF